MRVTFYTAKCPESFIYARFRAFFVQSASRGGRLLVEKPKFFDEQKHPENRVLFIISVQYGCG